MPEVIPDKMPNRSPNGASQYALHKIAKFGRFMRNKLLEAIAGQYIKQNATWNVKKCTRYIGNIGQTEDHEICPIKASSNVTLFCRHNIGMRLKRTAE